MAQTRIEEQTSTNSTCCSRHSTRSCFPAISSPAGQYSDDMEFSRASQSEFRHRFSAKMQSNRQCKLLCDWSFKCSVWFCHGNGFREYTVNVLQSVALGDQFPAFKQKKPSLVGRICHSRYFGEWIFKRRLKIVRFRTVNLCESFLDFL